MSELNLRDVKEIFEDVPSQEMGKSLFEGEGITIVDLLADAGVTASRGEG